MSRLRRPTIGRSAHKLSTAELTEPWVFALQVGSFCTPLHLHFSGGLGVEKRRLFPNRSDNLPRSAVNNQPLGSRLVPHAIQGPGSLSALFGSRESGDRGSLYVPAYLAGEITEVVLYDIICSSLWSAACSRHEPWIESSVGLGEWSLATLRRVQDSRDSKAASLSSWPTELMHPELSSGPMGDSSVSSFQCRPGKDQCRPQRAFSASRSQAVPSKEGRPGTVVAEVWGDEEIRPF